MDQEKAVYVSDLEVSKLLGIGRQTLCNWRCQQKGPRYVKSGRRLVRYAVCDIMAYMESRKIGTEDQPKDEG
jgi:predicted DNA-binding transcriptional regulator AlpA